MEYYQQLNWPQVPTELLDQLIFASDNRIVLDYGKQHYRGQQEIIAPYWKTEKSSSDALVTWMIENIPLSGLTDTMISQVFCGSRDLTYCEMIPHVDVQRSVSINYFVDTGGDNAITTWYQENGQPIVRAPRQNVGTGQTADGWLDYDNLTEVAQLQAQPNTWYLFHTDIIHGVKNLTGTRKYISISQ